MMALLTLEAEESPDCWSTIEYKLAGWRSDLELISQTKDKRTYRLNLLGHGQPIPLFKKLQTLLATEEIHFFIDLQS